MGEAEFADWGWRIPFLFSAVLLAVSVWDPAQAGRVPAVRQDGRRKVPRSKAPLTEAFGTWANGKIAISRCSARRWGEAVVWYGGQF